MSTHIARAHAITIPTNARFDGWSTGSAFFEIATPHGTIKVEAGRMNSLLCKGPAEAIIGFGLVEPDWLPGFPGRNETAQAVYFTNDGPVLPFGKNRTGKRPKAPRIIVRAWGYQRRTVEVQVPISDEQREMIAALKRHAKAMEERKTEVVPIRPVYRVEGNVIHLAPRSEWMAA